MSNTKRDMPEMPLTPLEQLPGYDAYVELLWMAYGVTQKSSADKLALEVVSLLGERVSITLAPCSTLATRCRAWRR